jgi:hypothetical protein
MRSVRPGALRQELQLAAIIQRTARAEETSPCGLVLSAPRLKACRVDLGGLAFGDDALVSPAPRKAVD